MLETQRLRFSIAKQYSGEIVIQKKIVFGCSTSSQTTAITT